MWGNLFGKICVCYGLLLLGGFLDNRMKRVVNKMGIRRDRILVIMFN